MQLLFNNSLNLYAPKLLIIEIEKHEKSISKKSGISENQLKKLVSILSEIITFVPEEEFIHKREEAETICPDSDDVAYFALAIKKNCALWTNDKKLKQQDGVEVITTHELLQMI